MVRSDILPRLLELERSAPPATQPGEPVQIALDASDEEAVLRLYGPIGPWDPEYFIGADAVARTLGEVRAPVVRVRLQSPGGSAAEGFAIYQQLRTWPGRVITQVDGIAASAAGLVFLAGDERLVPKTGALVMLHEARLLLLASGPKSEIRESAAQAVDLLEKFDAEIAALIAERSGMSEADAAKAIEQTTWYRPAEAIKAGIATGRLANATVAPGIRPGVRNQLEQFGASADLLAELHIARDSSNGASPSGPIDDGNEFLARLSAAEIRRGMLCA